MGATAPTSTFTIPCSPSPRSYFAENATAAGRRYGVAFRAASRSGRARIQRSSSASSTRRPPSGAPMIIAGVSEFAWFPIAYFLATGVRALAEVLLTRMKLAFALKLLHPRGGRDDLEAARNDLDAVKEFITPPHDRSVARPR